MAERHPLSVRFHELRDEMGELHDVKQLDYGLDADPFANVRATKDWGMPSWVGAMVRATDKVKRLQTFARKGELANESVIDAFMDLAVYALIGRVLYEEEAGLHSGSVEETPDLSRYGLFGDTGPVEFNRCIDCPSDLCDQGKRCLHPRPRCGFLPG